MVEARGLRRSKDKVKKQQMRWAPKGAHPLLQMRAKVLDDDPADAFQPWSPRFVAPTEASQRREVAA